MYAKFPKTLNKIIFVSCGLQMFSGNPVIVFEQETLTRQMHRCLLVILCDWEQQIGSSFQCVEDSIY